MFIGGPNIRKDYHHEEGEEVLPESYLDQVICLQPKALRDSYQMINIYGSASVVFSVNMVLKYETCTRTTSYEKILFLMRLILIYSVVLHGQR